MSFFRDVGLKEAGPVLLGVIVGFLLSLAGLIAGLIVKSIRHALVTPRLKLCIGLCEQTYRTAKIGEKNGKPLLGFFVSLTVENKPICGSRIAKDCYARLVSLKRYDADEERFLQLPVFAPNTLLWANQGVDKDGKPIFEPLDVEPEVPRLLGVCESYQHSARVHLSTTRKELAGRYEDFEPGMYLMRIRLYTGEGIIATDEHFIINHTGAWDGVTIKKTSRWAHSETS